MKQLIPGWILILLVTISAHLLSTIISIGGKHPIEASVLAIVLGITIRSLKRVPNLCESGVKAFEKPLVLGIVLVGASLNFSKILDQGLALVGIILCTMTVGFLVVYLLSRAMKLSLRLSLLLSVGTTVCGGTAIAVTAPLIDAKEDETSCAIGTIALWGLLAIILYPYLAGLLAISDNHFGIFAGTAIHSTPQVVGAGFIYSEMAGKTATAVKLVRNCFLAPMSLFILLWYSHKTQTEDSASGSRINIFKAFPWFLFGYFLMAWCSTNGYFSDELIKTLTSSGKFFILMGMAGIGLNTDLFKMKAAGPKVLFVGFIGALTVAATSAAAIYLFA